MKSTALLLLLLTGLTANAQTIRIADNNTNRPTGANIFSTLQAAINAAVQDDIVYITPSVTSYGDATVGKRITIKGAGFYIAELGPKSSTVGTLTISNSDNGTNSITGAKFTGFAFSTIQFAVGTGGTPYSNLIFENITGGSFNHTNCIPGVYNMIVRNCYISTIYIGACSGMSDTKLYNNIISYTLDIRNNSNPVISNNLFVSSVSAIETNASSIGVRIEHNIFSGSGVAFSQLVNGLVINNIFYGKVPTGSTLFHSNTFSNNLVLAAFTFPPAAIGGPANSGVNNIAGTGPLFTNAPVSSTYNSTYDYTLQAGSPCIGAATVPGENIGPSGGLYPWTGNLSLKASAIPVITLFGNSGLVPQNAPLKSNIKAKSN